MCEISPLTLLPDVDGYEPFERSFDFSKSKNLQELSFGFRTGWKEGGLPWIPMALSTLRRATSPRLSTIRLDFTGAAIANRPIENLIKNMGDDLRRIANEVARIQREFDGAVNFAVLLDPVFEVVLDTLNVRFRLWGDRDIVVMLIHLLRPFQILRDLNR